MGEPSRNTSERPSLRNHSKDFVWISTRFGNSRLNLERENDILVLLPSFCSFTLTIKSITPFQEYWSDTEKPLTDRGFCRFLTDLHSKDDSASDYNAVYNYIIKNTACQGGFRKKFKKFQYFFKKLIIFSYLSEKLEKKQYKSLYKK